MKALTDEAFEAFLGAEQNCEECNAPMEWMDCWNCGGEGTFDGYEDDPMWYDPGDEVTCSQCDGKGGWWYCTNNACGDGDDEKI